MEQRGISIQNAGTELVNTTLMIVDIGSFGNDRVWRDIQKTVVLKHDTTSGWIITDANQGTVYYHQVEKVSTNLDPWSVTYTVDKGVSPAPTLTAFDDPNIQVVIGAPVTEVDPSTGDKITKVTTTYQNVVTNDRYSCVEVSREKYSYISTPVERYDTVNLTLNKVYRFTFVKDFNRDLGYIADTEDENYSVMRGIYRVDKILSYRDIISSGIDIYNNLYAPIGIPKQVYDKDEPTFQNTMFYKLVDPRSEDVVIYMPLSFISGTPDGSVERYDKLLLAINLGVFSSTEMIAEMLDIFKELLRVKWGIYPDGVQFPEDMELVQFQRYDSLWLTTDDYNLLDAARKEVISGSDDEITSSESVLEKLFGSEMNKLKSENDTLKKKISAYEDIITNTKQG